MRKNVGFLVVILGAVLLFGCQKAGDLPLERDTSAKKSVTIETFTPQNTVPFSDTSSKTDTVVTAALTDSTDESADTLTSADSAKSEDFSEETAEFEPKTDFQFPEEFYTELQNILDEYELNTYCDNTSDCDCEPEFEETDDDGNIITPRKKVLSVYFKDIESGSEFTLNPGAHYPVASTVKIPFCVLIYQKLESGELDPETVLTYEERHYFEGTGEIVKGDFGQKFTVPELLELAITMSDNVAYEMLKDLVTWSEFSDFLAQNGCTHSEDIRQSKQKLCCESAGAYGNILADYLTSDGKYVEKLKEDLLNTRLKMIVSSYPVYGKYGWAGFSLHEIAYVDAPKPYILGVMSNLENVDNGDMIIFKKISELIEKYSQNEKSLE